LGGSKHSKSQTENKREIREIKVKAAKESGRKNSNKRMCLGFSEGLLVASALMYPGSNSSNAINDQLNWPLGPPQWILMLFSFS